MVAVASALEVTRPGGVIVQLGLGGETTLPMNLLVTKEISLKGTFRFHEEFAWAVNFLAAGAIDMSPLLTEVVPLAEAVRAFDLAADRTRAMKVQLAL
jgi:L-idonate 5-dehydrogenase